MEYKAVYVQKRHTGMSKILQYLVGEKVLLTKHYNATPLPWLVRIEVTGCLGEWNLRRVFELVNENDLRIEYSNSKLQIFVKPRPRKVKDAETKNG